MAVKFKKHWRIYNPGEVAGFEEDIEQKLIESDIAEKVVVDEEDKSIEVSNDKMVRSPKAKK
jgi:hypothetical protein